MTSPSRLTALSPPGRYLSIEAISNPHISGALLALNFAVPGYSPQ